jgi:PKD repeat protein
VVGHTYTTTGVFDVSLTVSNTYGFFTASEPGYIRVYESVDANFGASPVSGVVPLTVSFTNLSTGEYDTCAWTFGDGDTSGDCNSPGHTYMSAGVYTVSLTVSGLGGSDVLTRSGYITAWQGHTVYLPLIMRHDSGAAAVYDQQRFSPAFDQRRRLRMLYVHPSPAFYRRERLPTF